MLSFFKKKIHNLLIIWRRHTKFQHLLLKPTILFLNPYGIRNRLFFFTLTGAWERANRAETTSPELEPRNQCQEVWHNTRAFRSAERPSFSPLPAPINSQQTPQRLGEGNTVLVLGYQCPFGCYRERNQATRVKRTSYCCYEVPAPALRHELCPNNYAARLPGDS